MELRTYLSIPRVVVASLVLIILCAYIRFSEEVIALLVLTTGGS